MEQLKEKVQIDAKIAAQKAKLDAQLTIKEVKQDQIRKAKEALLLKEEINDDAFWKTMKTILPGEKTAISPKISTGQSINTDKKTIASAFNNFFVGAATRLLECLPYAFSSSTGSQNIHHIIAQHPAFKFDEVSEDFVKAELRALKTGKAMGLDNIPARLLIDSADIVAKPLAEMINCSLKSGRVPLDFKSTRVIPLFKKGKVVEMDNYHPISILFNSLSVSA